MCGMARKELSDNRYILIEQPDRLRQTSAHHAGIPKGIRYGHAQNSLIKMPGMRPDNNQ